LRNLTPKVFKEETLPKRKEIQRGDTRLHLDWVTGLGKGSKEEYLPEYQKVVWGCQITVSKGENKRQMWKVMGDSREARSRKGVFEGEHRTHYTITNREGLGTEPGLVQNRAIMNTKSRT